MLGDGTDCPILSRFECRDLVFSLDDQPECGALHAPGRETAADLFPQQGREIETNQEVECPARLLRVNEVL